MLMITFITYSQKKANGTIYIEHPAIIVVEDMTKAFVTGDVDKVASYLADDFKAFNGVTPNDKGQDKESFSKSAKGWHDALDYFSITRSKGAYPDAIEYKDNNQNNVVWVQTWENLKGVHKETGVKVDMPIHRLIVVNKDNKINRIILYNNPSILAEIGDSYANRENGIVYNHHENINTIRKMMYAFENKDFEKCYSFYAPEARFNDENSANQKSISLDEQKANDQKFLNDFDLTSIDMVGYPDYLHYELGDARVVQSWWNFNLIRKSDKKTIVLPLHVIDNFDENGKITSEILYYSESLLK